jgi:hypothetical protein
MELILLFQVCPLRQLAVEAVLRIPQPQVILVVLVAAGQELAVV